MWTLRYRLIFWRSWIYWTTFEVAISTWSILFLQQLHGLALATLTTQGSPPPFKILSIGSSFAFARRDTENQQGESSSRSCSLGRRAVAPMPIKIHWSEYYFPRRLRRTL